MNNLLLNLFFNIFALSIGMQIANALIPMPRVMKSMLNLLVLIVVFIFILQYFGIIATVIPLFPIVRH